jgi:hypothetical protein
MSNDRTTDHKKINLAQLHQDVVNGESEGKIIWQPRILCWIEDKIYKESKLPEPYNGLTKPEIFKKLGCSSRIYEYSGCFQRVDDERVNRYSEKISAKQTKHIVETPVGEISTVMEEAESSWAHKRKKWFITSEEDLKVAIWLEEHAQYKWNQEHFDKTYEKWGDLGAPTCIFPRVNIQHLYIDMMGVETTTYALFDYPDLVEKYFEVLDKSHERLIKVINQSPIDIINFGDNIHSGTLSPDLFKKYVLPAYQKRNELLHSAGKFTNAHWDGDTKPLLPLADETGLDGIEAITPKPQGDVTVEEIKAGLGDDMFLLDGIAAILFNETYSKETLIDQTKKIIDLFAPRLILGISDEISSNGKIERVKIVRDIVDDYNAQVSR